VKDSPLRFSGRRTSERRLLPSRRRGLDRRYQQTPVSVERRGGARRLVADRRNWTERRADPGRRFRSNGR